MKKFTLALLALILALPTFVSAKSPWAIGNTNNTNQLTLNGTWQGIVRSSGTMSLTGIMMFGTAASSTTMATASFTFTNGNNNSGGGFTSTNYSTSGMGTSGNEGRFVIYVNGNMVVGAISTAINTESKQLSGVFEGSVLSGTYSYSFAKTTGTITSQNYVPITTGTTTQNMLVTTLTPEYTRYNAVLTDATVIEGYHNSTFKISDLTFTGKGSVNVISADRADYESQLSTYEASPNTASSPKLNTKTSTQSITVSGLRTSSFLPSFSGSLTSAIPALSSTVTTGT